MRIKETLKTTSSIVFAFVLLALPLFAQNNKGTILGTVTDPQGALVRAAKVTVKNNATGETREVTSNEEGVYAVAGLIPGAYRVTVEANGFKTLVYENVTLETNARLPLNAKFTEVGGGTADVTITSDSGPLAESETSVRGDIITGREVTDLPIAQRNFTILAQLSPGVTRPVTGTIGGGGNFSSGNPAGNSTESTRFRNSGGSVISANGARVTNNNFTLDGVDNNESQFGQIGIYPNPDAISEFKIETSVPSAESGRAGGAIVSTTFKSGGNDFHGTAYEFYQGQFGSARPTNIPNPPNFVTHNYGFTVGGPIFLPAFNEGGPKIYNGRNKSFFFFSFARQRNTRPAFNGGEFRFVTVPTAAFRNGDFSALLEPNNIVTFNTVRGAVQAPRGTIFDSSGFAFPNNRIPTALLNQTALNVFNSYPLPTESGINNNYRRNRSEKSNNDGYDIKIDHNITQNNRVFGRYSSSKLLEIRDNNFPLGSSPTGNDLPSGFGAGDEFGNSRQVALGNVHTFSPSVYNDARAGYTRVNIGIFNPGVGGAAGFKEDVSSQLGIARTNICGTLCSGSTLLGVIGLSGGRQNDLEFIGDGGPFYFTSNNFYFGDTLTVIRGNHSMKFGGDLRVRQNINLDAGRAGSAKGNFAWTTGAIIRTGTNPDGTPMNESLNGNGFFGQREGTPVGPQESGNGYANFLLGYRPTSLSRGIPTGIPFLSSKEFAFFVQDDWKASSTLTLNLGLRYDVFTPQTERYDRQSNFDPRTGNLVRTTSGAANGRGGVPTDKNNFGPRVGFAWSGLRDDRKLVIRGGYGLLYSPDVSGQQPLSTNFLTGGGYSLGFNDAGLAGVNIQTGPPVPSLTSPANTFRPDSGTQIFYLDPDNAKSEIFHQYNLTAQYEFRPNWLAEVAYVGTTSRNLLVVRNIGNTGNGSRQVNFNNVVTTSYIGDSRYDALQTKLERRFSKGLSVISTYTWSHSIDNTPGGFCLQGPGSSGCGPSNPVLGLDNDRGSSDFDTRHRFTFANTYDLPIGRGRRLGGNMPKVLDFLIGGFQLNNVITLQSGPVYSVFGNGGRADIVGNPFANLTGGRELNRAAFRDPVRPIFASDPTGPKFGTSGRNIFRGQSQEFWDASLFKNFRLTSISEAFNVQLRVQAYNVMNHINNFRPEPNIGNDQFGRDNNNQRQRQLEFSIRILF